MLPARRFLWASIGLSAATALLLVACRDDWMRENPAVRPPAPPPPPLPPPPPRYLTVEEAMAFIAPFEGRRARVYQDNSRRRIPTVGVGFNLRRKELAVERLAAVGLNYKAVLRGQAELNDAQIDLLFRWDVVDAFRAAQRLQPGFDALPVAAQAVVVDLIFNIGPTGFSGFVRLRSALARRAWAEAADELLRSPLAKQVPDRAQRNVATLRSIA